MKAARGASNRAGAGTCEVMVYIKDKHAFHYFTRSHASTVAGTHACAIEQYYKYKRTRYAFDISFDVFLCF
jgi:hypothetical protein